ncbi:MAG: cytochrome c oxidase subunit II [Rubinisphaera brasiliensis]|uniref:Cytochrome c oxidase subunit 2 n=1 Tax=Rubinisphaera brasiliensis (strain ATCC 49424 / DSM 5305 / JCM 21570 / IAM 15109 / NBRC 103401 / IFAM 1448) TaxID=756272 RepID=F0SL15_RUBBR|nr:cytochrome c oxidase subunit II [Rubinisphaera brasiliensis]ADY59868.1 cytochrome c oxidase, subunit II [Rubinisphaera brasiliensis DSM 5305]MBB03830.1 cytochrome c oxidase subunit II [Planctomyces sp.]
MKRLWWLLFFLIWPVLALVISALSPSWNWAFPGSGRADSPLGMEIDHLFYLILIIITIVFIGTQIGLMYVLWTASKRDPNKPAWYSHGNQRLEILWTVIPGAVLLFIAFYQMRVWANFRMESAFPEAARTNIVAEVNARQFEWRIRYPAPGKKLERDPQIDDMFGVNVIHVPAGTPVTIQLKTQDVQHSFFLPTLRIKQDAVPGLIIPVWFECSEPGEYPLVCAELCGWGHYKMAGKVVAHPPEEYTLFMEQLHADQMDDGFEGE